MIITSVKDAPPRENPHQVDVRRLYNYATAEAMHITLQPGESLKPHTTPVDVFFYVLEGAPNIQVGEEIKTVAKDILVESPRNIKHCISNQSESVARILVVKSPKQLTKSILV
ncbi:cupin domain-containing protein [uncultured Draconibacterium sp.]|uniref:cupin domain-containing protein n=1 Tax=uncultured Draconibacterium sp. TaxID=1573823 RepID=UPI00321628DA